MRFDKLSNYILKQMLIDFETEVEYEKCSVCKRMIPILKLTEEDEINYCCLCSYCDDEYHCNECYAYLHICRNCGDEYSTLYVHYYYEYAPNDYAYCYECFCDKFDEDDIEYSKRIEEFMSFDKLPN